MWEKLRRVPNFKTIISLLSYNGWFKHIKDEKFLSFVYPIYMREKLDLDNPSTFNQKLQWLKLYNRKDIYSIMVDKCESKKYIANIIGEEYIIPTIAVYNDSNEINFDDLPNSFVMKCTHNSGGVVVVNDKSKINVNKVKQTIRKSLNKDYYISNREWPYKNVPHRIIVEQYMKDNNSEDLKDYKLFCFNGNVGTILVCSNRNGNFKNTDFYDKEWNKMPFTREMHAGNPNGNEKPKQLEEMIRIAESLSKDIPFVRVDLYDINDKVYFGEMTFFPSAGFEGFDPPEYDRILGDMMELPNRI